MRNVLIQISGLERFQSLHDRFVRGGRYLDLLWIALCLATAFGIMAGVQAIRRRMRVEPHSPGKLFASLIAGLELTVTERDLIRRLARELRLENPAILFISRAVFEAHGQRWLVEQGRHNGPYAERISQLSHRLFGP